MLGKDLPEPIRVVMEFPLHPTSGGPKAVAATIVSGEFTIVRRDPPPVAEVVGDSAHSIAPRLVRRNEECSRAVRYGTFEDIVDVIHVREVDTRPRRKTVAGLTNHHQRIADQHVGVFNNTIGRQLPALLLAVEHLDQESDEGVGIPNHDVRIDAVVSER